MYAEIVLRTLSRTLDQAFTYEVPEHLGVPVVGDRVVVPFGGGDRYMEGVIWQLVDTAPDYEIKAVAYLLDARYRMSRSQLILMQGIRRLYGATYSQSFNCVLPSLQQLVVETHYRVQSAQHGPIDTLLTEAQVLERLSKQKLLREVQAGALVKVPIFSFKETPRVVEYVVFSKESLEAAFELVPKRQVVARRILTHLHGVGRSELRKVVTAANAPKKAVMALVDQGLLSYELTEPASDPLNYGLQQARGGAPVGTTALPPLTIDQQQVVTDFWARPEAVLEGVTGSGKTRVYLELAKQVLSEGKQVLVLVPEIALTPQLVARFSTYLSATMAVLHSQVMPKDRVDYYRRIARGDIGVVIGARSALFAPFKALGLIILDEEHEGSYRSDIQPQYDTRDLALLLGQALPTGVLFGSASPSSHRMALVGTGRLGHLRLEQRIGSAVLPEVAVVDLRMTPQIAPLLTQFMVDGIREAVARGEQAIVLHNRKGFARFSQCTHCGFVEKCVNCDIPLTVYQQGKKLSCHYCSYQRSAEAVCSACGNALEYKGYGLEQVVDALVAALPGVSLLSLDGDSTGRQEVLIEALEAFQSEKVQVLVGTQLLAKGLDFPKVTFVGVLLADQMLNLPDYAAGERAMQLLLQVAGRAGRADRPGQVLIQTFQPEHDVIQQVLHHDYRGYLAQELPLREALSYPPYGQLYGIRVLGDQVEMVRRQSERIFQFYADNFKRHGLAVQIFPPKAAYYGKIKNKYVYQMVLKADNELHTRLVKLLYLGLVKNQYDLIRTDCHVDFSVNPTF